MSTTPSLNNNYTTSTHAAAGSGNGTTNNGTNATKTNHTGRRGGSNNANTNHTSNTSRYQVFTKDLGSAVFKITGKPSQYPEKLKQLWIYSGNQYVSTPEILSYFDNPPTEPVIDLPTDDPVPTGSQGQFTASDTRMHQQACNLAVEKGEALKSHKRALFLVIEGQFDPALCNKLESKVDIDTKLKLG